MWRRKEGVSMKENIYKFKNGDISICSEDEVSEIKKARDEVGGVKLVFENDIPIEADDFVNNIVHSNKFSLFFYDNVNRNVYFRAIGKVDKYDLMRSCKDILFTIGIIEYLTNDVKGVEELRRQIERLSLDNRFWNKIIERGKEIDDE